MNQLVLEIIALVAMLAVGWCVALMLLSGFGGWSSLATAYRLQQPFNGKWHLCSGRLGFVGYGSCLKLAADPTALYLGMLLPFRLAHPPLRIPWRDVKAELKGWWLFKTVTFRFNQYPSTSLNISEKMARVLANESNGLLSIPSGA